MVVQSGITTRYGIMTAMFSKPKKPDTSRQTALLVEQEKKIAREESETKRREASASNARRARSSGRASLITGGETGVNREVLG